MTRLLTRIGLAALVCVAGILSLGNYYRGAADAAGGGAPTPDLLWWKMNNGPTNTVLVGDAATSDDGTHDADYSSSTKSGSGYALDLVAANSDDGSTDSTIAFGTNIVTVAFWLNPDSTASLMILLSSEDTPFGAGADDWTIYLNATDVFAAQVRGATGIRREQYTFSTTGAWTHFLVVLDGSTATGDVAIYEDGVLQTTEPPVTDTKTGTNNYTTDTVYLGSRNPSPTNFYDGLIDDVRVYSGDQSASVTAIMNEEL